MTCKCDTNCECKTKDILPKVLANTYVLLLKTQNVHWNVVGENFRSIHLMTEEHYNDLFQAIDEIAEQIRMHGEKSPATFEEYSKLACFSEKLNAESASDMLAELLENHETLAEGLKKAIGVLSESDDFTTVDLLTERLAFHEKAVWMLKSTLKN